MILNKKRVLLVLPVILISCVSFKPLYMDLSFNVMEGEGQGLIGASVWEGNTLILSDKKDDISIEVEFSEALFPNAKASLTKGEEFRFNKRIKPDGPVEHLIIWKDKKILAYLADGIRKGNLPGIPLEIIPLDDKPESVELNGPEDSWIVQVGKAEKIEMDGASYKAFLLNTEIGLNCDQPPLEADLMLIRQ